LSEIYGSRKLRNFAGFKISLALKFRGEAKFHR